MTRCVEVDAAVRAEINLAGAETYGDSDCEGNSLPYSSIAFRAAKKPLQRHHGCEKHEETQQGEGGISLSVPQERRNRDQSPPKNCDGKGPPNSPLDVVADGFIHERQAYRLFTSDAV